MKKNLNKKKSFKKNHYNKIKQEQKLKNKIKLKKNKSFLILKIIKLFSTT